MTNPYTFTDNPTLSGISICDTDILNDDIMYLKWGLEHPQDSHALKSYLDDGTLLTDSVGLNDVISYAHSTFDLSKFTKVGNPTITTDGVASNFSTDDYISFAAGLQNYNTFDIVCGTIKTLNDGRFFIISSLSASPNNDSGFQISINSSGNSRWFASSGNGDWDIAYQKIGSITYAINDLVTFKLSFNGTRYTLYSSVNGGAWQVDSYVDSTVKISTPTLYLGYFPISTAVFASSIDLKDVSVTLDGVPTFAGNQTGTDTYTINSSTVTVPYTLSKTGSKIVNSYYRTQVQAVYNEFGYAPYYTLSDTDFTLPMGELYGFYQKYALKTLNGVTLDYSSLISQTSSWGTDITAPDNGYVFAQDNIATGGNITFKVNNVTLYTSSTGGTIGYTIPIIIPVAKGDVYNISGGSNAARALNFVPMKGV